MNVNPCLLQPENWVVHFNRICLFSLVTLALVQLYLLRLLSFCLKCSSNPEDTTPGSQLRLKQREQIKVEVLDGRVEGLQSKVISIGEKSQSPLSGRNNDTFFLLSNRKVANSSIASELKPQKDQPFFMLSNRKVANSGLSTKIQGQQEGIKEDITKEERERETGKGESGCLVIELKQLKVSAEEFGQIVGGELAHQYICIAMAIMYFPFGLASLIALMQFLLLSLYYFERMCCGESRMSSIVKAMLRVLNVVLLWLAIYGLSTSIPKRSHNSCFDL